MARDTLAPEASLLGEEYVLVQAWKKTVNHIRYHNWFADTLALDYAALDLPRFLAQVADRMSPLESQGVSPLRIVPAPKSQLWELKGDGKTRWGPTRGAAGVKLRPLAHVDLVDQVAATALMLCLADRVETLQGDPRLPTDRESNRRRVLSYGNRLFCDTDELGGLRHRWGSSKLYRSYYEDYKLFIGRAERFSGEERERRSLLQVQVDLRQFYDRVTPDLLAHKVLALEEAGDDPQFFEILRRHLRWRWAEADQEEVERYRLAANIEEFREIALPQGLVASGFFANVVLLDFDDAVRSSFGTSIREGVILEDACRYVDDLRIVLSSPGDVEAEQCEQAVSEWLSDLLSHHAPGMELAAEKTRTANLGTGSRPLLHQARRMQRIQEEVSGGFDAVGGQEILGAVQGLVRAQHRFTQERTGEEGWRMAPVPDVRDDTVSRFAAARFRRTYRSLRPLLPGGKAWIDHGYETDEDAPAEYPRTGLTQGDVDNDARAFALGLVEAWIRDPSSVRLLRVALDIWPSADLLEGVLSLLRPWLSSSRRDRPEYRVAAYCLAEILKAGATETGIVDDVESLPTEIDLSAYRRVLLAQALRIAMLPAAHAPWYLRQQALLFILATGHRSYPLGPAESDDETRLHSRFLAFVNERRTHLSPEEVGIFAVLNRRVFGSAKVAAKGAPPTYNPNELVEILSRDVALGLEILRSVPKGKVRLPPGIVAELGLAFPPERPGARSLLRIVVADPRQNYLRNEIGLLRFAEAFLSLDTETPLRGALLPTDVQVVEPDGTAGSPTMTLIVEQHEVGQVVANRYTPPDWAMPHEQWRFQLGYLMRFILAGSPDFTVNQARARAGGRLSSYQPAVSHWVQRRYGLFNGVSAFEDDWLPVTEWMELLLGALVAWPGCASTPATVWVGEGIARTLQAVRGRLRELLGHPSLSTGAPVLPIRSRFPGVSAEPNVLRAGVLQTVVPGVGDFPEPDLAGGDLTLSGPVVRKRHRRHLSAALAALERMLTLRETHHPRDGRLDWLILPELAVHPDDVRTHLVPFVRRHKAIVLAGMTYQELLTGQPLVNTAVWVIPERSIGGGFRVRTVRQGKHHLAALEESYNAVTQRIQRFRPCQWLIGVEVANDPTATPLWLSAAVCYDATDLSLATVLRDRSDVFAIPALNKDVGTFDQMSLALQYHMYQYVVVANNGTYGGSSAYAPFKDAHRRQVFHLHGQPQASVVFFEIEDVQALIARRQKGAPLREEAPIVRPGWKWPPAGV